jgi:hypothetical protein
LRHATSLIAMEGRISVVKIRKFFENLI